MLHSVASHTHVMYPRCRRISARTAVTPSPAKLGLSSYKEVAGLGLAFALCASQLLTLPFAWIIHLTQKFSVEPAFLWRKCFWDSIGSIVKIVILI